MDILPHIITLCRDLHRYLGPGHLESVYARGLLHRLEKAGLHARRQARLEVRDIDGIAIGEFHADLLVENLLLVELEVVPVLTNWHAERLQGHLQACPEVRHGLLVNFGATELGHRVAEREVPEQIQFSFQSS